MLRGNTLNVMYSLYNLYQWFNEVNMISIENIIYFISNFENMYFTVKECSIYVCVTESV